MELVVPMYNMHTYFSLKNLCKKYTLYMAKYGIYCSGNEIKAIFTLAIILPSSNNYRLMVATGERELGDWVKKIKGL